MQFSELNWKKYVIILFFLPSSFKLCTWKQIVKQNSARGYHTLSQLYIWDKRGENFCDSKRCSMIITGWNEMYLMGRLRLVIFQYIKQIILLFAIIIIDESCIQIWKQQILGKPAEPVQSAAVEFILSCDSFSNRYNESEFQSLLGENLAM